MAWPDKNEQVSCVGFPRVMLPALKRALSAKPQRVTWLPGGSLFAESGNGFFEWCGVTFELEEFSETVMSIRRVSGEMDYSKLGAAT